MYVYQEFPKWKYHAVKDAVIVESKEAEAALGDEWANSPAPAALDTKSSDVVAKIEEILEMPKKGTRKAKA